MTNKNKDEPRIIRVPKEYITTAKEYMETMQIPYLPSYESFPRFSILAEGNVSAGYKLRDADIEGEPPPSMSWKEYAGEFGWSVDEIIADYELDESELDDQVPEEMLEEWWGEQQGGAHHRAAGYQGPRGAH